MSYLSLYRKFRPETFDDVKGQDPIVITLKNQLKMDRVGHAYLFCGTRGTGKTTIAKILARAVNCEHPVDGNPCGECQTCQNIKSGASMNVIEIDAASNNGVENVRDIRDEVAYPPTSGKYKVYIIDEVHMLSNAAFNALLKTLEEPPSYVIFIMATTEAHKIPATILSRCQRYDFRRISLDVIANRLSDLLAIEGVKAEERAVRYIAKAGDGSMRDALSLLDQCISFYLGEELTFEKVIDVLGAVDTEVFSHLVRCILAGDVSGCISILDELVARGRELSQLVIDLTWYLRNLLLLQTAEAPEDVIDASRENMKLMQEESRMAEAGILMRYIRILSELTAQLRYTTQRRVLTEVALIRLCRPSMDVNPDALLDRIRVLESRIQEIEERGIAPRQDDFAGDGNPSRKGQVPEDRDHRSEVPPKPAPRDLQRIKENWNRIVNLLPEEWGGFRTNLSSAALKYDPESADPILFVEFSSFLGENYADQPEYTQELMKVIQDSQGVTPQIRMIFPGKEAPARLSRVTIDEALGRINAQIETVDDDEFED
ncbi:MAG: DNA polymerase III subunit gamma/tau [Blautia sp.]|nr:DNA polymerase III subunit gamma/tau [Blautia sp.]